MRIFKRELLNLIIGQIGKVKSAEMIIYFSKIDVKKRLSEFYEKFFTFILLELAIKKTIEYNI